MGKHLLVIGSGGREHALAWKLAQSPMVSRLSVAPGNAGTAEIAENVDIKAMDFAGLVAYAKAEHVDLTVVGPDDPLAAGIVDLFQAEGLVVFGPTAAAARIEASKAFAKQLMAEGGLPTAGFTIHDSHQSALAALADRPFPLVVKASGLALGKGVYICHNREEGERALKEIMLDQVFGQAGQQVVIEEFLTGQEISIHVLSDGKNVLLFPPAQDHKPVGDGDTGPNTGGMGTIAPLPWVTPEMMADIERRIVRPVINRLDETGRRFTGLLYPGLKMTPDGPKILEFNARFGDPETESYMRLLKSDLYELLMAAVEGRLDQVKPEWRDGAAVCIMLASKGYPGAYPKGLPITGIEEAQRIPEVVVFHAGTARKDGQLVTNGGRVLGVTAWGESLEAALKTAYQAAECIRFEGKHYRADIGSKAINGSGIKSDSSAEGK